MTHPHAALIEAPDYDAGLLNDYGGGNIEWWQDYLRAEIGRANDYWRSALSTARAVPAQWVLRPDLQAVADHAKTRAYWDTVNDRLVLPTALEPAPGFADGYRQALEDAARLADYAGAIQDKRDGSYAGSEPVMGPDVAAAIRALPIPAPKGGE